MSERARSSLEEGGRLLTDAAGRFAETVEVLAGRVARTLEAGGRVMACGNGGSASDAEHVATELAGRFHLDRPPVDVFALTANSSLVTALANDYGYDEVFARQVRAHGRPGDILLLFTTSGTSPNVVRARDAARELDLYTVGFTSERGRAFGEGCDVSFIVPSRESPRIQEVHIALGHALCECVEAILFGSGSGSGRSPHEESPG